MKLDTIYMIITEVPSNSVVQNAKHSARRVVTVGITIVVVEVERAGVSTIAIVPTTNEPRVGTVRKVSVYFTVYNLFHQHDETKNNLLPVSFFKETGRSHRINHLLIFLKKKIKRNSNQIIFILFIIFYSVPVLRTGSVREKKEPELTPTLFGHSNQLLFQITICPSSVPKEPLTSSVQSAKHSARRADNVGITIEVVEDERAGASTIAKDPTTEEPRAGTVRKVGVI